MGMKHYQDAQEQLPPKLLTEGARVDPEWLRKFLSNPALSTTDTNRNGVRPYLQVRMPTFSFSDNELRKLVRFFQALSQQPMPYIPEQVPVLTTKETDMARSLFSSTAAPCLKCHATGDPQHDKIATAPNFLLARERLKPDWVERWILDPQAISPGTAMPSGLFKRENNHWVFSGPTPPSFQGYDEGPQQAAGGLHIPADGGGAAAGGGLHGTQPGFGAAAAQAETGCSQAGAASIGGSR